MLKPVLGLAATGVAAILLWKLMVLFLLPLFGVALALVFMAIKIGFIVALVAFAVWLLRRTGRREAAAT
jgi:hypothetical protein